MVFRYLNSFYGMIPFAILLFLYQWSRWKRRRDLLKLGEWKLIQKLIPAEALQRRKTKDVVALVALFFLLIALAGPQFGSQLKEIKHRGVDVFIAMDVSRSMLAEDVLPTRLDRAKRSLTLLIQKLQGNRVGL